MFGSIFRGHCARMLINLDSAPFTFRGSDMGWIWKESADIVIIRFLALRHVILFQRALNVLKKSLLSESAPQNLGMST